MRTGTQRTTHTLHGVGVVLLLATTFIVAPVRSAFVSRASAATIGSGSCATTVSSTTGVTASTSGSSCILQFKSTTTYSWTSPPSVTSLRILVVGGGGGAGSRHSGGGGAGGMLTSDAYTVTPLTTYSITVGAGGTGLSDGTAACGSAGSASSFGTVVANGGGPGCNPNQSTAGGSSGGTGNNSYTIGAATPGTVGGVTVSHNSTVSGVTGYGNIGGSGFQQTCESAINTTAWCGGGGGGAGGAGGNASTAGAGGGGAGKVSAITGSQITYAGGGGGAGGRSNSPCPGAGAAGGTGGSGIGGSGGGYDIDGEVPAGDGVANTGSGGGGGAFCDGTNFLGGSGGSGIVIVRWIPDTTAPSVSSWTPPTTPTKNRTVSFGLSFNESISDLTSADFSNAGTATCTFSPDASSGTSFTVTTNCTTDGTVIATLASNAVTDLNANSGPSTSSASTSVVIDTVAPTVSWDATPTLSSSLAMQFLLTSSESISGVASSDFSTSGTASSCSVAVSSSSGTSFTITATCTAPGTVTVQMASLSAADAAGNAGPVTSSDSPQATIPKLAQSTVTVTSTTATYGQTLALTATGGNGTGSVTWQKTAGTCTVTGSSLTPGDAGSLCEVRATRAGDDSYEPKASVDTTITINKANQATLVVATTSVPYGRATTLTATGGSGSGAVTFDVVSGTCVITSGTSLTPGTVGSSCVVRATKATDTNYSQALSSNATITVTKGSQSGFSISSDATFQTGSNHDLTTTGGQGTGSVTWAVTSGQCAVSGATLTAAKGGITCTVEATRTGDNNHLAASDTQTISVTKIPQTLSFQSTAPTSPTPGSTYTVRISSTAFLAATVAVANSSSAVCTISSGVVTFTAIGTCLITASQAGNDVYTSATTSQSIVVVPETPSTTTTSTTSPPQQTIAPTILPTTAPTTLPTAQQNIPLVTTSTQPKTPDATSTTTPNSTTPVVTSSSTTTTTTEPGRMTSILGTEVAIGETFAMVQGKKVAANISRVNNAVVISLPGSAEISIGAVQPGSRSAGVSSDGVLRVAHEQSVDIEATRLQPQSTYTVVMYSKPIELVRGTTSRDGVASTSVLIPRDAEVADHTLQITGADANAREFSLSLGFTVIDRNDNTMTTVLVLLIAVLLALLGGRPLLVRMRTKR